MIRRIITITIDVVSVAIILIAAMIMLSVVFTKAGDVPSVCGHSLMCVVTGSMEPEIPTNSLVIVKMTEPEEIKEGDIIAFYSKDPSLDGAILTHRAIKKHEQQGRITFTTKGDANGFIDEYPVDGEMLIGKVIFISAHAGILVKLSSNPLIFIPLILVPLALMVILNVRRTFAVAREIEKEQQQEALRKMIAQIKAQQQEAGEEGADEADADDAGRE